MMSDSWAKCAVVSEGDCPPCSNDFMKYTLEALRKELDNPVRLRALVCVICESVENSILVSERNFGPIAPSVCAQEYLAVPSGEGAGSGEGMTFPTCAVPDRSFSIDASFSSPLIQPNPPSSSNAPSAFFGPGTSQVSSSGSAQLSPVAFHPTQSLLNSVSSVQMPGASTTRSLPKNIPTSPFPGHEASPVLPFSRFKQAPAASTAPTQNSACHRRAQELHGCQMRGDNRHNLSVNELTAMHLDPNFDPVQYAAEMSRFQGISNYFDFSRYAQPPKVKKTSIWSTMIGWLT